MLNTFKVGILHYLAVSFLLSAPVASATGVIAQYKNYTERNYNKDGELTYQIKSLHFIIKRPKKNNDFLLPLTHTQQQAFTFTHGELIVSGHAAHFDKAYYSGDLIVMTPVVMRYQNKKITARSAKFEPTSGHLNLGDVIVTSTTGKVLSRKRSLHLQLY